MTDHLTLMGICNNASSNALSIPREERGMYTWTEDNSTPYQGTSNVNALFMTQFVPPTNIDGMPCLSTQGWEQWPHPWLDGQGDQRPGEYWRCDDWYIRPYCVRCFIFTCVYHDGLKFHWSEASGFKVLNLLSIDKGAVRVPAEYPYVTECWDTWTQPNPQRRYVWSDVTDSNPANTFQFYKDTLLDDRGMDPIMQILERRYGSLENVIKTCLPAYTPIDVLVYGASWKRVRKRCLPCACYGAESFESMSSQSTSSTSMSSSSYSSTSSESSILPREFNMMARDFDDNSYSSISSQSYSTNSSWSESSLSYSSTSSWESDSFSSRSTDSTSGPGPIYDEACTCDSSHGGITPWMPKETMPANHKLQAIFRLCKGLTCKVLPPEA